MRKLNSGRSLVEMIGVMSVGAIMIAIALRMGDTAIQKTKRTLTITAVSQLETDLRSYFWGKNREYYGTILGEGTPSNKAHSILISDGFDPRSLIDGWGNQFLLQGSSDSSYNMIIQIQKLKTTNCVYLFTKLSTSTSIKKIKTSNTSFVNTGPNIQTVSSCNSLTLAY